LLTYASPGDEFSGNYFYMLATKIKSHETNYCIILFYFLVVLVNAQYGVYKNNYDVENYSSAEGGRYEPFAAGILAIIPGVGHLT
jgi:hypothetical protein